jgi:ABC-type lipoprotein export system ATPase subunit
MERTLIRVRGLRKTYPPDREVLRGIDFDVQDGSFVAIVGRSGSGKTTLLNIIGGLDTSYHGSVEAGGTSLASLNDAQLSELRSEVFGHVFQAYHLLDHMTVAENTTLPWLFARGRPTLSTQAARRRAAELLEEVGLRDRADDQPCRLSGGERQRLAIARALFSTPKVLLCDEPTGNLDPATGTDVVELLARVHKERGVAVVAATHDDVVSHTADRRLVLQGGVLQETP